MAIFSRFGIGEAKRVKKPVKRYLSRRIRQRAGISDDFGSSSEGEYGEGGTGSIIPGSREVHLFKDTLSEDPVDRGATLLGHPSPENWVAWRAHVSEPDTTNHQFGLCRGKDRKHHRRARRKTWAKQEDTEMGKAPGRVDEGGWRGPGCRRNNRSLLLGLFWLRPAPMRLVLAPSTPVPIGS